MKRFTGVCLITHDVRRLRDFYENVLDATAEGDDVFATFSTLGAGLALCSIQIMDAMAPDWKASAGGDACTLEFEVDDVDQEYERLKARDVPVVKPPTTQPWGLRSVWFRDPDGNTINFWARVAPSP